LISKGWKQRGRFFQGLEIFGGGVSKAWKTAVAFSQALEQAPAAIFCVH
jgi:hypothetical protein